MLLHNGSDDGSVLLHVVSERKLEKCGLSGHVTCCKKEPSFPKNTASSSQSPWS